MKTKIQFRVRLSDKQKKINLMKQNSTEIDYSEDYYTNEVVYWSQRWTQIAQDQLADVLVSIF